MPLAGIFMPQLPFLQAFADVVVDSIKLSMFPKPGANQYKRQHHRSGPRLRQHSACGITVIVGICNEVLFKSDRLIMAGLYRYRSSESGAKVTSVGISLRVG